LGLSLISLMAASGTIWFWLPPAAPARTVMEIHRLFANLTWAYLIAHAGLAMLHHLLRQASLTEMWSLRR
jgi:cytochrome b561